MGMTIGKTIEFYDGLECCTPQAKDARDVAINTMRKYQKIEQIISDGYLKGQTSIEMLIDITEVMNGNVD